MTDYDILREEILELFAPLASAASAERSRQAGSRLADAERQLRAGKLTVLVCGECNQGKSCLVNALLEDPGLCPVDTYYATNLVSVISYGPDERIDVTLDTGARRLITRKEIARYAGENGNPHNTAGARLLTVVTPNPRLSSGLLLADTPGVGGVYQAHTAATMEFLPQADVVVFVVDATQPMTESELRFLRRVAGTLDSADGGGDGLLCVLTKTDVVADLTEILANTREKLNELTPGAGRSIPLVAVSSRAKLQYLTDRDPEDLELSNFPALETALWSMLARRRCTALLGAALTALDEGLTAVLEPLDTERAVLVDTPGVGSVNAQAQQERLAALSSGDAAWRLELEAEFARLSERLHRQARDGLDEVWQHFDAEYLHDDAFLYDPDSLVGQLESDAALTVGAVREQAVRRAAEIQRDFEVRNGLELRRREFAVAAELPVPPIRILGAVGGDTAASADRLPQIVESALYGAGIGAALGGPVPGVGTVTLGLVGLVVGAWSGYMTVQQQSVSDDRRTRRQDLQTALGSVRRSQEERLDTALTELLQELSRTVLRELGSRLGEERERIRTTLERTAAAAAATAEESTVRREAIDRKREPLLRVRERVEALTAQVRALYEKAGG
ncbi:dynamin family protein [Streptomyces phaeochromogenes]|uniref:dynamin family protein n=1 Tax=Streptomyces phaeochromogenes TaxID=1923 RepID=UPI0033F596D7